MKNPMPHLLVSCGSDKEQNLPLSYMAIGRFLKKPAKNFYKDFLHFVYFLFIILDCPI